MLDKKARASEIKRSIFDRDVQSYHANMLESTRKIGSEAYDELKKANQTKQEAVAIQQRAERKAKEIEPLHRQAEQEYKKAKELREQQEQLIEQKAEVRASEMVREIMKGTPEKERDRMRRYMESLQFGDGTTALERFDEQERQLAEQLHRKTKSKGYER